MRKAKNKIDFEEYSKDLFENFKAKAIEFIEDIDFDKIWLLIEKRLKKCRERKALKNKDLV